MTKKELEHWHLRDEGVLAAEVHHGEDVDNGDDDGDGWTRTDDGRTTLRTRKREGRFLKSVYSVETGDKEERRFSRK